jgi:hypothetical protein
MWCLLEHNGESTVNDTKLDGNGREKFTVRYQSDTPLFLSATIRMTSRTDTDKICIKTKAGEVTDITAINIPQ